MNVDDTRRKGLLGFAIEREQAGRQKVWLQSLLRFSTRGRKKLTPIDTCQAPIQKFRWSDYCVYPATTYTYTLHGSYGDPKALSLVHGPSVTVTTEPLEDCLHQIVFNRAAAASQAYQRQFGGINPDDDDIHPKVRRIARKWLARGLDQKLRTFVRRANSRKWALDVAIYEIELEWLVDEILNAHELETKIRVVYHAKPGDSQTQENEEFLGSLPDGVKRGRITSSIFHQKFMVLSKVKGDGTRDAVSVLTGSTNFTLNGVYRQANVVHVVDDPILASEYLELFELLFKGTNVSKTREHIDANNAVTDGSRMAVFSPRSDYADTQEVCSILKAAKSDVLFCTAFQLHPDVMATLKPDHVDDVIRYGLQNRESEITGVHRRAEFVAPAYLKKGIEGFMKESLAGQRGSIYIHLKAIVCDFTTDHPVVITGSNNFSRNSSHNNDENMLIIRGDTAVADTYFCEMMRLYDHYRFRHNQKRKWVVRTKGRLKLRKNDKWTNPYFKVGSLKEQERVRFSS
jgi:hypothetical protein